jgi:hypothetical protein
MANGCSATAGEKDAVFALGEQKSIPVSIAKSLSIG